MRTQIVRPIINNGRTNLTPGDAAWPDFVREALHEFLESLDEKTTLLALTIRMRSEQQLEALRLLLNQHPSWLPAIPVSFEEDRRLRAYPDTLTIVGDVDMQRFFLHFFKGGEYAWTRAFSDEFKTPRFSSFRFHVRYDSLEEAFVVKTGDGLIERVELGQRLPLPGVGSLFVTVEPEPPTPPRVEVDLIGSDRLSVSLSDGSAPSRLRVRATAYEDGRVLGRLLFEGGDGERWEPLEQDGPDEMHLDPFGFFDDTLPFAQGLQLKLSVSVQTPLGFAVTADALIIDDYPFGKSQYAEFLPDGSLRFQVTRPGSARLQHIEIVRPPEGFRAIHTLQRRGLGPRVELLDAHGEANLTIVSDTPEVAALGFVALLLWDGDDAPRFPIDKKSTHLVSPIESVESLAVSDPSGTSPILVSLRPMTPGISVKGMSLDFPAVLLTMNGPRDATGSEEILRGGEHLLLGRRFLFTLEGLPGEPSLKFRGVGIKPREAPIVAGDPDGLSKLAEDLEGRFPLISIFQGAYFFRLMPKEEREVQYALSTAGREYRIRNGSFVDPAPGFDALTLGDEVVLRFVDGEKATLGYLGPTNNKGNLPLLLGGQHHFVKRCFFRPRNRELAFFEGVSTVHWRDDEDIQLEVSDTCVSVVGDVRFFDLELNPLERPLVEGPYLVRSGSHFLEVERAPLTAFPSIPFRIRYWGMVLEGESLELDGESCRFLQGSDPVSIRRIVHQLDLKNFAPRPLFVRNESHDAARPLLFEELAPVADDEAPKTKRPPSVVPQETVVERPALVDGDQKRITQEYPPYSYAEDEPAEPEEPLSPEEEAVEQAARTLPGTSSFSFEELSAPAPVALQTVTPLYHGSLVEALDGPVAVTVVDRMVNPLGTLPAVESFPLVLLFNQPQTVFTLEAQGNLLTCNGITRERMTLGKSRTGASADLEIVAGSHISRAHDELFSRAGRVFVRPLKERLVAPSVLNFERVLTPDQAVRLEDGDWLSVGYHLYQFTVRGGLTEVVFVGYIIPRSIKGEAVRRIRIVAGAVDNDAPGELTLSVGDALDTTRLLELGFEEIAERLPSEAASLFAIEAFDRELEVLRVRKRHRGDLMLVYREDGFLYRPLTDFHAVDPHTLMDDIVMPEFYLANHHRENSVCLYPPRLHKEEDRRQMFVRIVRVDERLLLETLAEGVTVLRDGARLQGQQIELADYDLIDCRGAIVSVRFLDDALVLSLYGFLLDERATVVGNAFDVCDIFMEVQQFNVPARRGLCAVGDGAKVTPPRSPKEWIVEDLTSDRVNLRMGRQGQDFEYELAGESRTLMDPFSTTELLLSRGAVDHRPHFPLPIQPEDGFCFARVKRGNRGFLVESLAPGLIRLGPDGLRALAMGESVALRVGDALILPGGFALKMVRSVLPDYLTTLKGCSLAIPAALIVPIAGRVTSRTSIWRVVPNQHSELYHPLVGRIEFDGESLFHGGRAIELVDGDYKIVVE